MNTELKITPGPWKWQKSSDRLYIISLSSPTGSVINTWLANPHVPACLDIDNPSDRVAIEAVPLYEDLRKATNTLRAAVKAVMANPLDYNLRKAAESAGYEVDAAIEVLNAALEKAGAA
ncbi:hypothetical protein [Microcystis phage Mvi-JY20]|uniref:Uncharacterized protein n=1 Tax=Microcystis phage Mvi-JY20 TaxID=3128146 RepID=A0AAX4QH32_9CAUD